MGEIVSVNVSRQKRVPKSPVAGAELVVGLGIAGDAHAAPGDRQVSLLMIESIDRQRARMEEAIRVDIQDGENRQPVDLVPGIYAENLTTRGVDLAALKVGDRLKVGKGGEGVLLRVSRIGKECHAKCAIFHLVGECVMPKEGVFCEVLHGCLVRPGDPIAPC